MSVSKFSNFSLWCDFIERDFLDHEFPSLLQFIDGATSNPSIFANSILKSPAYKAQIASLKNQNPKNIYETLAIADVKKAANILKPLWEDNQDNGYISIEIDPLLSQDVSKSIDEGKRLFDTINMPNVMIKVPATQAGYEVMYELLKIGIPINATLIFSPQQAQECSNVFENARKSPQSKHTRSVISVFVSRFDRISDPQLEKFPDLQSKLGIYNAMECYNLIEKNQDILTRTLFASTGVKGNHLPKTYYLKALLLPHTINTAPLDTIKAYMEEKNHTLQIPPDTQYISQQLQEIQNAGVDIEKLYQSLMQEGLEAFVKSFEDLLSSI
ncbi:transaldolase [Helicobacter sp. 11S03491-1]|uniref:transaldolase n=1 Tax=Helicobacter sp. 11S03491-1 TaxID=1476196 RepID=UPI000BA72795|nr:transaldolase [Helicobacter sp. 11S03491-1]PAF43451.1 transaldolase [Helicobacter sp. 11S03491-1]